MTSLICEVQNKIKQNGLIYTKNRLVVARGQSQGEGGWWMDITGEGSQKVQTTSYKITKFQGYNMLIIW